MVVLRPVSVLALILLSAAVAGCLGGDSTDTTQPSDPGSGGGGGGGPKNDPVEEGEGDLRGMVLDDGYSPVSGASVRLTQDGATVEHTSTGPDGLYEFTKIPAGGYRLEGTASCCREKVEKVTVKAGEEVVQDLRLERQSGEERQRPFRTQPFEWNGVMTCGVSLMEASEAPCDFEESNHDVQHNWNVTQGLRTLYVYVEWEAQPTGEELYVEVARGEQFTYGEVEGSSPLVLRIDNDDYEEQPAVQWENIEDQMGLSVNVLPGGDVGVFYELQFTVVLIEFHWREAPENFEFQLPD